MTKLTGSQLGFLAREVIRDKLTADLRAYVQLLPEEAEALRMAQADLDKARATMEDYAAFNQALTWVQEEYPTMNKRDAQREAREWLTDADFRFKAVKASGLYEKLASRDVISGQV